VTTNSIKRGLSARGGRIARCAARRAGITRDAGSEPGICRVDEATEHLDDACANVRLELLQELFLLVDQIGRDPRAEPLALPSGPQRGGATILGIRALFNVSLPNETADHAAGCALIQEQPLGQRAEALWTVLDERLEGVALRHGDVVAADAVAIAKLIDADQIGDRFVQRLRVTVEGRLHGMGRECRTSHCCY